MSNAKVRPIINSILIVQILISIVAVITMLFWLFGGASLNQIDKHIVSSYVEKHQKLYTTALEHVNGNKDKAIEILEDLLARLKTIKKMDRLAPIKRKSLSLLTKVLSNKGQYTRALFWAEQWIAFDEKDLFAQSRRGRIIYLTPGREGEGTEILADLFARSPESEVITEAYAEILLKQGLHTDAFIAYSTMYHTNTHNQEKFWKVYWSFGDGFDANNMNRLIPELVNHNKTVLNFQLHGGVKKLRIDPPPYSRIEIFEPKLFFEKDDAEEALPLWTIPLHFHQISQDGSILKTFGKNDPYFYWALPERRINIKFEFQFSGTKPEGSWHIFWDVGDGFNPKNMKGYKLDLPKDDKIVLKLELKTDVKRLRIDPPPYSNISIFEPKITIKEGTSQKTINILQIPLQFHQMSKNGMVLKTTGGNDPFFFWKMPQRKSFLSLEYKLRQSYPDEMVDIALKSDAKSTIETELIERDVNYALEYFRSIIERASPYTDAQKRAFIK